MEPTPLNKYAVYKCKNCSELLYSKSRGHFCKCKCGNFIDQTEYYCRVGGDFNNMEFLGDVDEVIK